MAPLLGWKCPNLAKNAIYLSKEEANSNLLYDSSLKNYNCIRISVANMKFLINKTIRAFKEIHQNH